MQNGIWFQIFKKQQYKKTKKNQISITLKEITNKT